MSEHERKVANQMLIDSTNSNGQLDIKTLEKNTNALALKEAKEDPNYAFRPSAVVAMYKVRLIRATNEVLGLVPEKDWDHTDGRDSFTQAVSWVLNGFSDGAKEAAPSHGLQAQYSNTKDLDRDKTLAEQHVTASKPKAAIASR